MSFLNPIKEKTVMKLSKQIKEHNISHKQTIPPMPEPVETKLSKEQRFVKDVINLANERNLNCFVITDGASGITNIDNETISNIKKAYMQLESEN
jgi:hypothetical protein